MAFPTSYVNGRAIRDSLIGGISFDTDAFAVALYSTATGGDKNALETYDGTAPWNANEVTSTGYTGGGLALNNPTIAVPAAGKMIFDDDVADREWTGVTFTAAGCVVYSMTSGDQIVAAISFGGDQPVVAGTFTLTWDGTNGIFYATY